MNMLKEIKRREADYSGANVTRIYNAVVPTKGGEFRVDTYAVKTRNKRTGELAIKKVARYRTDRKNYWLRDILYSTFWHTYSVNWCNEPFGRKHRAVWSDVDAYIGRWSYCDRKDGTVDLGGTWLNSFKGTKYEHCGWNPDCGIKLLEYLDCWHISKGVEFLGKAGLYRLIRPSFVRKLSSDKELFGFFRSHLHEIRREFMGRAHAAYTPSEIEYACRHDTTLDEASIAIRARYAFRDYGNHCALPRTVDKVALLKWCWKNHIDEMEYCRYANYVGRCGEDISAFGVTMPRNFKKALEAYERRAHRKEARRLAEERKAYNSAIKSVAEAFAMLTRLKMDGLTVILPTTVRQLVDEGSAMRNCIGRMGYDERIAKGTSLIVFLHKDGKPFVDMEIDREHWKVRQCYAKCNTKPSDKVAAFAKKLCARAKMISRRHKAAA